MGHREKSVRLTLALMIAVTSGYMLDSFICGIIMFLIASFLSGWGWQSIPNTVLKNKVKPPHVLDAISGKMRVSSFCQDCPSPESVNQLINLGLYIKYREKETLVELIKTQNKHFKELEATLDYSFGSYDSKVKRYKPKDFVQYGLGTRKPERLPKLNLFNFN